MRKLRTFSIALLFSLFGFILFSIAAAAQTNAPNQWTWMGGSNVTPPSPARGEAGVFGTLGTPAAGNVPGSRSDASTWTDAKGNLWLFGGNGYDVNGANGDLNDLWEFNSSTNEWAWMGGGNSVGNNANQVPGLSGVYGTLGTPDPGNIPGGRFGAASWSDDSGHFWLFGGDGIDSIGQQGWLNDLWEFNPATNQWAWMAGSSTAASGTGIPGVYGTLGTPAAGNNPGSRMFAVSWTDKSGNLWMFGGLGYDSHPAPLRLYTWLNDLWEFSPSTNEWTWMGGSSMVPCDTPEGCEQSGTYGTLGTPAAGNIPGGRSNAASWVDSAGHFWLFGGMGIDSNYDLSELNDLWEFNPSTSEWTWVDGSSTVPPSACAEFDANYCDLAGVYGTLGTPAASNIPGGRDSAAAWTDSDGNFWLFGGSGYDANGNDEPLNDLWEFTPSASQWTWMGGDSVFNVDSGAQFGVFGTLGVPAAGNIPGSRGAAATWTDGNSNFWLFGGEGPLTENGTYFLFGLNDLWSYQPSSSPSFTSAPVPTFSVAAGTYTSTQSVTISDAAPEATIYYTTDGSTPTLSSTTYTEPIAVSPYSTTETIKAFAVASGYLNSAVASATYVIHLPATSATVTTLTSSPNPSLVGEYVTFTATVIPVSSTLTPTGTVQFIALGALLGPPVALNGSGVATYTTAGLFAGGASVTARYTPASGSPFTASTSSPLIQSVEGGCPGTSGTSLTSSLNPSAAGQPVTFTANVGVGAFPACAVGGGGGISGPSAPLGLQGSVQFTVNGIAIGSPVPLVGGGPSDSGTASWTTSTLPPGTDTIIANFIESNGYVESSSSAPLSQVVSGSASDFSVAASPAAVTLSGGSSGTASITVTPQNGFNAPITFACSSGLPAGASCSFSPQTVTPSGGTASTTLTVTASSTAASIHRSSGPWFPASALAVVVCCFGLRKRRRLQMLLLLAVSALGLWPVGACGGSSNNQIQPVTSMVTVTATAGTLQHTTTFSITVN